MSFLLLLSVFIRPADAAPAASRPGTSLQDSPTTRTVRSAGPRKKRFSRDIQGFRPGMGMKTVKQLLKKKRINDYKTGFTDLFIYSPAYGAEVKLQFTCGVRERVLSAVELSTKFPASEVDRAVASYSEKLSAKYGPPVRSESGHRGINMCWGACGPQGGRILEATTKPVEKGDMQFVVALRDPARARACAERRTVKINRWLNRWTRDIRKFQIGMSLNEASLYYQKRYHDRLVTEEEQDQISERDAVWSYTVRDYDFFSDLDYESVNFEGEGPGTILMKFTADQADPKSRLNKRLYYALFTTTAFSKGHAFTDMQTKIDAFIMTYGNPVEVLQSADQITAQWRMGSGQVKVSVMDSGLITVEQSAPGIKNAYRDSALRKFEELRKNMFDTPLF